MKKPKLKKLPYWARQALQGVAFWVAHRRCMYKHYLLGESALVAEICNLIHANLDKSLVLHCEKRYEGFLPGISKNGTISKKSRVDLSVFEKPEKKGDALIPRFVIEVKRASASNSIIDGDLQRLAAVRNHQRDVRAFLFIIAEAHRPNRFVNEKGNSRTGKYPIADLPNHYRVRRTLKAASAYRNVESAQYACLLEIFRTKQPSVSRAPKSAA
jgi:hypothetical protein